jgi:hypothetical protein
MTGAPYIVDSTTVRNQFMVRIVNKRNVAQGFTVRVNDAPADVRRSGVEGTVEIGPLGEVVQPLILQKPRASYDGPFRFSIQIGDTAGSFSLRREVEFLGPEARLLREEEEEKRARK